jgi:hypothetical protein
MTARVDSLRYARPACSNYTPCGNGDTDCARCGEIGSAHSMTARVCKTKTVRYPDYESGYPYNVITAELSEFGGADRPDELRLPAIAAAPVAPRKVGWLERLISGPQGDPYLRSDFYSFLGRLACGTGLALVFLAIILAGRVLLGGQS